MNKQQRIIELVRNAYERAHESHKKSVAEDAAAVVAFDVWNSYNPDDGVGGISVNPYNPTRTDEAEKRARTELTAGRKARCFV